MNKVRNTVMLITPPYHAGVVESAGRWPNLAFINLAGELERLGFEVEIYDAMSRFDDYEQIRERLRTERPAIVGTTAFTASVNAAVRVLEIAREEDPEVCTVIGGLHPTFLHGELLEGHGTVIDVCVVGEGEVTVRDLFPALRDGAALDGIPGLAFLKEGRLVKTAPRPFLRDLDTLVPAWHKVRWKDYPLYFIDDSTVAILSSSRGCIHACAFCSQHKFWEGTYRDRDPVKFVDEMEHLVRTYGINVFFIADEYPTRSRERWERILDELIRRRMGVHVLMETCVHDILRDADIIGRYREAGILFVYLGVEATNEKRLADFKKANAFADSKEALRLIRENGMIAESSLILGTPDETPETIEETLQLAFEYDADFMHFLFLAPWPYADMYESLKPYIEEWDYSKYNLVEPIIKPLKMTRPELHKAVLSCYRRYYQQKMPKWAAMKGNELKRSCLIKGMKSIMQHSFLKDHMKGLGSMPEHVVRLMESLGGKSPHG